MSRSIAHTRPTKPEPARQITLGLHTLLHTVRSIAKVEDELCTLLHEVERTGTLTPETTAELHALLNQLPTQEYAEDLEAVRSFLTIPVPHRKTRTRKAGTHKTGSRKTGTHKTGTHKAGTRKAGKAPAKPKSRKAKS